ncbi:MAG: class I SAM-dependent methyltransferase [Anaerolineales bacterium]|nr:class I SAM-dependent methyltransferase [Anaerolineales bacterium]
MNTDRFRDKEYLQHNQYQSSENLDARIELHRRFSTSLEDFHEWMFGNYLIRAGDQILEVGCGSGELWRKNIAKLPQKAKVTLTDLSAGMIQTVEEWIKDDRFIFQTADTMELTFDDDSFDIVIANHMLYHLSDINQGLSEISRVLKQDGIFYAATNGEEHMQELYGFLQRISSEIKFDRQRLAFNLENGHKWLGNSFERVERKIFENDLQITEIYPLINYIRSMSFEGVDDLAEDMLCHFFEQELKEKGIIFIQKSVGMFSAN